MKSKKIGRRHFLTSLAGGLAFTAIPEISQADPDKNTNLKNINKPITYKSKGKKRNIVFILIDDLRYDCFSFMGHPFLKTPNIDKMVKAGANCKNAFVTTSLCSPSRASILTGQYMHNHNVVDNNDLMPEGTVTFPQLLQNQGYKTAFIGKWHMGGQYAGPRPGFDRWVSFHGQGIYFPKGQKLNVDGREVPQKGYITDELTDYAVDWIQERNDKEPFFLYLSHKAIHGPYLPPKRHAGIFKDAEFVEPETMADTEQNYKDKPMWVKNQRNSWHGVDFPYHTREPIAEQYRRYCELILSIDESLGKVMKALKQKGIEKETLVMFMGDNGHYWGEHGLIDKRSAYEESIRVPLFAHCPELIKPGTEVKEVVANIDIAETILQAANTEVPKNMDGKSFLHLLQANKKHNWRKHLLYEYYWEWNYPHTPTTFALRGDRYKLIQYHGIWDIDELYDIKADPHEKNNLINDSAHKELVRSMRAELHTILKSKGGNTIPFGHKLNHGSNLRHKDGAQPADYPPCMFGPSRLKK